MSRGINKVILIGNVGQSPETKISNGVTITYLTLATGESYKDKETGENKERTEWHRVVAYGKISEIISNYVVKGSKIYVEGYIKSSKWTDKDGNEKNRTDIVANNILMLSDRPAVGQNNNQNREPSSQVKSYSPPDLYKNKKNAVIDMDDDIPF